MNPLPLRPLPSLRFDDESRAQLMEMEHAGFVDEAAVTALMAGPRQPRISGFPEDLALAADDLDFAGWRLGPAPRSRGAEVPPQVIDAIVRRASPPPEPGLGSPHHGGHRWWLAGLAGILTTLLFSLLLLSLSTRSEVLPESPPLATIPASQPPAPVKPLPTGPAPELTEVSSPRP